MSKKFHPRGIKLCSSCKRADAFVRVDKYDAVACKTCNIWLEAGCPDPKCEFCAKRPQRPDPNDWNNKNNTFY